MNAPKPWHMNLGYIAVPREMYAAKLDRFKRHKDLFSTFYAKCTQVAAKSLIASMKRTRGVISSVPPWYILNDQ
jgi:hypothetical protein